MTECPNRNGKVGRIRVRGFFRTAFAVCKMRSHRLHTNGRRGSSPEHVRPARRPNGFGAARRGARVTAEGAPDRATRRVDAGEPRDGREPRACARPFAPPGSVLRRPKRRAGKRTTARAGQSGGGAPDRAPRASPPARGASVRRTPGRARAPRANRTVAGASPRAPGSRETLDRGRAALVARVRGDGSRLNWRTRAWGDMRAPEALDGPPPRRPRDRWRRWRTRTG